MLFETIGVFSTGATGAIAPVILRKRLIAPAVSTRNGTRLKRLILGSRTKIINLDYRLDRLDRPDRLDRLERLDRLDRLDRPNRLDRLDRRDRLEYI